MCKNNVCIVPLVVAVLLGIIVGALLFFGIIPVAILETPLIIGLIFAIITLILFYITAISGMNKDVKRCFCDYSKCLILGTLATLIFGFLALSIVTLLVTGGIFSAILVGLFGFGLILNFLSFAGLIVYLVRNICNRTSSYCNFENEYK